ncbi:MAG: AsmA family protein, partial [Ferruginibacter sp.]
MESTEKTPRKKRSLIAKAGRVLAWIIGSLILLIILVLLLIQTAPVQNFARKKIVTYLENKLKTKVEIGKLDIKFPTSLSLQNVFLEDQSKDTLVYGGELRVNLGMFKLIKGDIDVNEIYLDNIVAKVKRLPPDSTFNFQFIIDAFGSSKPATPKEEDTSAVKINIDRIIVKNTRVVYKDALTGNDMDLTIGDLDTKISTFDPTHMVFEVPSIKLKGLKGHLYQLEPLQQPVDKTVAETASQPETYLQFINKEMNFSDVDVVYKSEPSHLNTSFTVGNLVIHPKKFDLKNGVYALDDVALDNSEIVVQTDSKKDSLAKKTNQVAEDSVTAASGTTPFKFLAGEIRINKSNLKYDDASAPHVANGMDFSHLNISNLALDVNNIEYTTDTTLASVKSASFNEQSGFILNNFTTDFSMYPTGIFVKNLLIQTP